MVKRDHNKNSSHNNNLRLNKKKMHMIKQKEHKWEGHKLEKVFKLE
jgi:hypothetical protein